VRAFSFTASITPVLVGAALAVGHDGPVAWSLLPLVVLCSLLFHAGTNVVSDYYDFRKGVDRPGTLGSSGVLVEGLMEPAALLAGGLGLFLAGCVLGLVFVAVRGAPMLVLGVVGLMGGLCYTGAPVGYKYLALGDVFVFILMGPLMVIGSFFALTGAYHHGVLLASLPIGCLVAAILHANNMRDIAHDTEARVRTLANVLGHSAARWEYLLLVAGAFVAVGVMAAGGVVPAWALLAVLSAPPALANTKAMWRSDPAQLEQIATLDVRTAQHHFLFGLLYAAGIALGSMGS